MRLGQYERAAKAPGLLTEKNLTLERAASLATAIEMTVLETHESNHHAPSGECKRKKWSGYARLQHAVNRFNSEPSICDLVQIEKANYFLFNKYNSCSGSSCWLQFI